MYASHLTSPVLDDHPLPCYLVEDGTVHAGSQANAWLSPTGPPTLQAKHVTQVYGEAARCEGVGYHTLLCTAPLSLASGKPIR